MLDLDKSEQQIEDSVRASSKKRRARNKFVVITLVCVSILGIVGIVVFNQKQAVLEAASRQRMDESGFEVKAAVHEIAQITRKDAGNLSVINSYRVSYTFEIDSGSYDGKGELENNPYSTSVAVVYDPENPAMNKLKQQVAPTPRNTSGRLTDAFKAGINGVLWVIGVWFLFGLVRKVVTKLSNVGY